MSKAIAAEINRVVDYARSREQVDAARTEFDRKRLLVTQSPDLERFLRYQASFERGFDRALAQLERLQRIRRGQPILPAIKLDVTT